MRLTPRNSLDSFFKVVRVFKVCAVCLRDFVGVCLFWWEGVCEVSELLV